MSKRRFRYFHKLFIDSKRLLRFRADPRQVALGTAIGVFIGVFPTLGTGMLLSAFLARYIRFHLPAALLMGTLSVVPPLGQTWIVLSAWAGGISIAMVEQAIQSPTKFLAMSTTMIAHFFWGCLIVSALAAVVSYGAVLGLLKFRQRQVNPKSRQVVDL